MDSAPETTLYTVTETRRPPWPGLLLGAGGMLPIAAGAIAVALVGPGPDGWLLRLTLVWSGAILAFLAGVRRGLSFRSPGGASRAELASMLLLFGCAFAALLALRWPVASLVLLICGYLCVAVFDKRAAGHHEAPPFFAELRPVQMAVAVASFALMLARLWLAGGAG